MTKSNKLSLNHSYRNTFNLVQFVFLLSLSDGINLLASEFASLFFAAATCFEPAALRNASNIPPKNIAAFKFSKGTNGSKDLKNIDITFT